MANVGVMLKQKQGSPCMVKWIGNILNRTALKVRLKICPLFLLLTTPNFLHFQMFHILTFLFQTELFIRTEIQTNIFKQSKNFVRVSGS